MDDTQAKAIMASIFAAGEIVAAAIASASGDSSYRRRDHNLLLRDAEDLLSRSREMEPDERR